MSGTEDNETVYIALPEGIPADITQGNLHVAFSATGAGLAINGKEYRLKDDIPFPSSEVGAPAIIRHKLTSGRYGLKPVDIGQRVHTDNLYQGVLLAPGFHHIQRNGLKAGVELDIFTTEHDTQYLTTDRNGELATYDQDVQRIANLDIYGHRGTLFNNEVEIYNAAIINPEQLANWHMPVQALVNGFDVGRNQKQHNPYNMYNYNNSGILADSFKTVRGQDSGNASGYWSATRHQVFTSEMYGLDFTNGSVVWDLRRGHHLSSRPVRGVRRLAM